MKPRRPLGAPGSRARRGVCHRAAWLLAILPGFVIADAPRIASLNLCTDVLLLEAVPSSTRLLLTALAADPNLSPYAARAARQARHRGLAEEILAFEPDWVVAEIGHAEAVQALLVRAGVELLVLPSAADMTAYEKNLARVSERLGIPAPSPIAPRHAAAEWQAMPVDTAPETALVLAGNAYAPGPETLADDLLAAAGLQDARVSLDLKTGGEISLETLLLHPPGFLVRSAAANGSKSLAEALLTHRALRRRLGEAALIPVPESLWICGSQRTRDGVALITDARLRATGGEVR